VEQPAASARPTLTASAIRIFELSLGQMLWSKRSVFLALLVGGPVVLAVLVRLVRAMSTFGKLSINGAEVSGPVLFGMMIWLLYIKFIIPVLGAFYGTALIADEVDDKTITYLFVRPIPRSAIVIGKYLAYLACTVLLVLPSIVLIYFLIVPLGGGSVGREFPSLAADLGILALGLAAYGALFVLVGALVKRPLVAGLVFVFGWEPGMMIFPGYLKRATVAYYLQGLVPHAMPDDSAVTAMLQLFREIPTAATSLTALAVITVGTLLFAGRTVESKEYVLEQ
jgi:ABC-2 type transport system permease protein